MALVVALWHCIDLLSVSVHQISKSFSSVIIRNLKVDLLPLGSLIKE